MVKASNGKYDIVPANLAVKAMRDNGYKNTAYAIAELIDNSVQAEAKNVELLCRERNENHGQRTRRRVHEIAIIDDGVGMTPEILRAALQFGNGTRLSTENHRGIGRFGMGLPASSISQCRRVDVWSWKDGAGSAYHTYLDVDEISAGHLSDVPQPTQKEIPKIWREAASKLGNSGTLVVWSDLDRLLWRTASAILDNSEFLVGRMYRYFLGDGSVKIRLVGFEEAAPSRPIEERYARANDPLYLMKNTSCPEPFDSEPMFEQWGPDRVITVGFRGEEHKVTVRFSYAKELARAGYNPGHSDYGKHAGKNLGVSIVRAGRELELNQAWCIQYDPVERWWGIEVSFPPGLDEVFGVTNNKQYARNFDDLAKLDLDTLLKGGKSIQEVKEEMADDEDPRAPLVEVAHAIEANLSALRKKLKAQSKGKGTGKKRHSGATSPEERATGATTARKNDGHQGTSDREESLPPEQRQAIIQKTLVDEGLMGDVAKTLAAKTVTDGLKYVFAEAALETPAFFTVKPRGGSIIITLNTTHPAYRHLVEVLEESDKIDDVEGLRQRLENALDGLKTLLYAWARFEDEQPDGRRKEGAQDARTDWGRVARGFFSSEG